MIKKKYPIYSGSHILSHTFLSSDYSTTPLLLSLLALFAANLASVIVFGTLWIKFAPFLILIFFEQTAGFLAFSFLGFLVLADIFQFLVAVVIRVFNSPLFLVFLLSYPQKTFIISKKPLFIKKKNTQTRVQRRVQQISHLVPSV